MLATSESMTVTPGTSRCANVALSNVPLSLALRWTEKTLSNWERSRLYSSRKAPTDGCEVVGSRSARASLL